jgi:uncharacterized membrane protein
MYQIECCPVGQKKARIHSDSAAEPNAGRDAADAALLLHMRENRSSLPQEARTTLSVMVTLFMATAILPAMKGNLLVPIFSIGTMGLLVLAIEWHRRSAPAQEWLALEPHRLRYKCGDGQTVEFIPARTELVQQAGGAAGLRLLLTCPWREVEIGRCLNLEEKRALAMVVSERLRLLRGH